MAMMDNTLANGQMAGTYQSDTMPVIEYYRAQGKVAEASRKTMLIVWKQLTGVQVDSSGSIDAVHKLASAVIKDVFAGKYGQKEN